MDECIKNILKKVQKSEKVQKEIKILYKKQEEMNFHIRKMKEILEKYHRLPILPNDCECYPWFEKK